MYGKYVRVVIYRDGDKVELCISPIWDPSCEDSIVLIGRAKDFKEKAEELINEIASLVYMALEAVEERR